jgi:hypothetical protein
LVGAAFTRKYAAIGDNFFLWNHTGCDISACFSSLFFTRRRESWFFATDLIFVPFFAVFVFALLLALQSGKYKIHFGDIAGFVFYSARLYSSLSVSCFCVVWLNF